MLQTVALASFGVATPQSRRVEGAMPCLGAIEAYNTIPSLSWWCFHCEQARGVLREWEEVKPGPRGIALFRVLGRNAAVSNSYILQSDVSPVLQCEILVTCCSAECCSVECCSAECYSAP